MKRRELIRWMPIASLGLALAPGYTLCASATPGYSQHSADPLDDLQLGHLRHIQNLAAMPHGEWRHMGSWDPGQEWLDAYRYQLAFMAYALALTTYHYLPAAPKLLQPSFDQLIQKMLRREVWGYWKDTSQAGKQLDPGRTELREGWIDPVIRENIMYSGHLHAMLGMYRMLHDDAKYDEEGSIRFEYNPIYYGLGTEVFTYSHTSLNDLLYQRFKEHEWLGIPCEPNAIFIVCNQYPVLGFKFYDAVHGTNRAEEVVAAYLEAWQARHGFATSERGWMAFLLERQNSEIWDFGTLNAWTMAAMNSWNPDLIRGLEPTFSKLWLKSTPVGTKVVRSFNEIQALAAGKPPPDKPSDLRAPDFGYVAMYLSEMGETENLNALLAHADRFMNPTWENSGLYYPRNDSSFDADGNLTYMDPLTGNALLSYARLNVKDGLRAMYQHPWRESTKGPEITAVDNAIVSLAIHTQSRLAIKVSLKPTNRGLPVTLTISGLSDAMPWNVCREDQSVIFSSSDTGSYRHTKNGTVSFELDLIEPSRLRIGRNSA